MKKLFLCLIIVASHIMAMEETIEIPGREELERRFDERGLTNFAQETSIFVFLAGRHKKISEIAKQVEEDVRFYVFRMAGEFPDAILGTRAYSYHAENLLNLKKEIMNACLATKPRIYEALLVDHSHALRELRSQGLYTGSCGAIKGISTND